MDNDLTDEVIRRERDTYRKQSEGKEYIYIPPDNAKRIADICDRALGNKPDLRTPHERLCDEEARQHHCHACGEPSTGPYCEDHK